MLVFFIHGVGTKDASYAKDITTNIQKALPPNEASKIHFYSSFWGNLFNNKKHQATEFIRQDVQTALSYHDSIQGSLKSDIFRYKEKRFEFVNNFLGDFLTYQNPKRGEIIRQQIVQQFLQFLNDHPLENEIHFIAHSLGSLILWDLLFSKELEMTEPVQNLRQRLKPFKLASITTLGSPLLFLMQFLDIDFSELNHFIQTQSYQFRWVNIIHSSDLIAYPLQSILSGRVSNKLFFVDQFIWLDGNSAEFGLRIINREDAAMVTGAPNAHSAYFSKSLSGEVTGQLVAYNLLADLEALSKKRITSWDKDV